MKRTIQIIRSKLSRKTKQEKMLDFVTDRKVIRKAVDGSMTKRIELIDRVELKEKHA